MSQFMFLSGAGHLPKKADTIARKHGARLVNYTGPECYCGYGCRGCNRRHWFVAENLGSPFDSAREHAVSIAIEAANIQPIKRSIR